MWDKKIAYFENLKVTKIQYIWAADKLIEIKVKYFVVTTTEWQECRMKLKVPYHAKLTLPMLSNNNVSLDCPRTPQK